MQHWSGIRELYIMEDFVGITWWSAAPLVLIVTMAATVYGRPPVGRIDDDAVGVIIHVFQTATSAAGSIVAIATGRVLAVVYRLLGRILHAQASYHYSWLGRTFILYQRALWLVTWATTTVTHQTTNCYHCRWHAEPDRQTHNHHIACTFLRILWKKIVKKKCVLEYRITNNMKRGIYISFNIMNIIFTML